MAEITWNGETAGMSEEAMQLVVFAALIQITTMKKQKHLTCEVMREAEAALRNLLERQGQREERAG